MNEKALIEFVKWAISEGPFEGCHLDGGSIQDKAEKLGILIKTKYDRTKHGESAEADDGDDWYEFAPWIAAPPLRAREEIARNAKRRADEFVRTGFRDLGVPSLDPYVAIIAELLEDAMLAASTAGQEWRGPDGLRSRIEKLIPVLDDLFAPGSAHSKGCLSLEGGPCQCGARDRYYRYVREVKQFVADWPALSAALPVAEPPTEQAPGHTDLMVSPESIDAFMEANPLPDEPIVAEKQTGKST